MVPRKKRQLTRESVGGSADGYFAVPFQVEEWIGSIATLLWTFTFHLGSRGVSGASVLLVGLEAVMKFSRQTPLVRGVSLSRYGNDKEYRRDAVTDAALKPRDMINKTIGIVYSRAPRNRYAKT